MSSKTSDKKYQKIVEPEITIEKPSNLKKAVFSFSQVFSSSNITYIYTGEEKIPFKERHPVYQALLKSEFRDVIREFIKNLQK